MGKIDKQDIIVAKNILARIGTDYGAQARLARKINVTPVFLNRVLKHSRRLGQDAIKRTAAALNCTVDELYKDPDTQEKPDLTVTELLAILDRLEKENKQLKEQINQSNAPVYLPLRLQRDKEKWFIFINSVPETFIEYASTLDKEGYFKIALKAQEFASKAVRIRTRKSERK